MNVALWVLQGFLAFLYVSGGAYKAFKFAELAKYMTAIPHGAWRALGLIEMVGGVLLVVPGAFNWMPQLTWVAAAVLAVETLGLAAMYASKSLKLSASNPMPWAVLMGAMAAIVAYCRYM